MLPNLQRTVAWTCSDLPSPNSDLRLKIPGLFAILHRRLARLVIRAGTTLRHTRGGDFVNDIVQTISPRFQHAGADHVRDGAHANDELLHLLIRLGPAAFKWIGFAVAIVRRRHGQPLAAAAETFALVAEINARHFQLLAPD